MLIHSENGFRDKGNLIRCYTHLKEENMVKYIKILCDTVNSKLWFVHCL